MIKNKQCCARAAHVSWVLHYWIGQQRWLDCRYEAGRMVTCWVTGWQTSCRWPARRFSGTTGTMRVSWSIIIRSRLPDASRSAFHDNAPAIIHRVSNTTINFQAAPHKTGAYWPIATDVSQCDLCICVVTLKWQWCRHFQITLDIRQLLLLQLLLGPSKANFCQRVRSHVFSFGGDWQSGATDSK